MSKSKGLLRTLGEARRVKDCAGALFGEIRAFGRAEAHQLRRELEQQKAQLEELKLVQEERKRYEEKVALAELRRAVQSMQQVDASLKSKEQEVIAAADELERGTQAALERMLHQRAADILATVDIGRVVAGELDMVSAMAQARKQQGQQEWQDEEAAVVAAAQQERRGGSSSGSSAAESGGDAKLARPAPPPPPLPLTSWLPMAVLTDSYKTTHYLQYPDCTKMVAYGEFRSGFDADTADTRLVFFGIRYIVETFLNRRWTVQEVEAADAFYAGHRAPAYSAFPYPKHLFLKFIEENDGYIPVKVQALPEGSCVHAHVPVYQITSEGPYAPLCTWLETLLTMVWYPTSVATLSRRCKTLIAAAFEASVDGGAASPLLASRLHDFGFRGCTCVEQSVLGGVAHLLNFDGTDTLSAAYYAQFALNGGRPVGQSIPATEHSVMTAWPSEREAIVNMIARFGGGVFATVMDSYDYTRALAEVVPSVAAEKVAAGGFWVLRPDSGDPVDAVLAALKAVDATFGSDVNAKGFKVPHGVGVIQGDGICYATIGAILEAVLEAGFSAEAVDVLKAPKTDASKASLPGVLGVRRVGGVPTAFPAELVVYDCGPVKVEWPSFDALRARVEAEWAALPPTADVVSPQLKKKRLAVAARLGVTWG
eukprot:scaffold9.g3184.t1